MQIVVLYRACIPYRFFRSGKEWNLRSICIRSSRARDLTTRECPNVPQAAGTDNTHSYSQTTYITNDMLAIRTAPRIVRQVGARRYASSESSSVSGAADNAFNRERQAVKDHAAATSGMS